MKSVQLLIFVLFPLIFIQLTSDIEYTGNSINNFDITKNSFAIVKDTSEYEKEMIYENRREIARNVYTFAENVYTFQRRIAYNISNTKVEKKYNESPKEESLILSTREKKCFEEIEKLKDIYFDLNKFTINKDAEVQINKATYIMSKCPNLVFIASSYTDSRGSSRYNKRLSKQRANAVIKYISDNYDVSAKISGVGYGESGLKNHCSNGIKCTKNEHQVNRRTEIRLSYK